MTQDNSRERARNAMDVLGNPAPGESGEDGVTEGDHYDVLAYTDYMDMFIPTVVEWNHGEMDMFKDLEASKANKKQALRE